MADLKNVEVEEGKGSIAVEKTLAEVKTSPAKLAVEAKGAGGDEGAKDVDAESSGGEGGAQDDKEETLPESGESDATEDGVETPAVEGKGSLIEAKEETESDDNGTNEVEKPQNVETSDEADKAATEDTPDPEDGEKLTLKRKSEADNSSPAKKAKEEIQPAEASGNVESSVFDI